MRLTNRDIELIELINRFDFLTIKQIINYYNLNQNTGRAYQIIRRLVKNEYIQHNRIFFNEGGIYHKIGFKIRLDQLKHDTKIFDIYNKIKNEENIIYFRTEKELRKELWKHTPDLLININNRIIAVEYESSIKSTKRIKDIEEEYLTMLDIDEVRYYTEDERVYNFLQRNIKDSFFKIIKI